MTLTRHDFSLSNKNKLKRLVKQAYKLYDYSRGHTAKVNKEAYRKATKLTDFLTYKHTKELYFSLDKHFCSCGNLVLNVDKGCGRKCKDTIATIQTKTKQTCLRKYGTKHHLSADSVIKKREQTCKERYGVSNVFQAEHIKNKIRSKAVKKQVVESNKPVSKQFIDFLSTKPKLNCTKKQIRLAAQVASEFDTVTIPHDLYNTDIFNYHYDTLIHSHVKHLPSLYEATKNLQLYFKAIYNLLRYMPHQIEDAKRKYFVLKRFTIAKIAPLPTTFQPYLAYKLLQTYANDCKQVVDPFSGFSGRMLGTFRAGKSYVGFDINKCIVEQSNKLKLNKHLTGCSIAAKDLFKTKRKKYECLLTCPPYNLKETWNQPIRNLSCDEWIDEVLKRYECRVYIFVVDKTIRYTQYVQEIKSNGSANKHINKSSQQIVVIRKQQ